MTTIKFRRGAAAQWEAANPVLAAGEPGFETDTGRHKIGDGTSKWSAREYFLPQSDLAATYVPRITKHVAEGASVRPWLVEPVTPGHAAFEVGFNSYENSGAGSGTRNHAFHMGYNIGRHNGGPVSEPAAPSWYMGFEDYYFDPFDDHQFGAEWYVSLQPTHAQPGVVNHRPLYVRTLLTNLAGDTSASIVNMDIGAEADGRFTVYAGITSGDYPFQVAKNSVTANARVLANEGLTVAAGKFNVTSERSPQDETEDRVALAVLNDLPSNSHGAYVGWAHGIAGTLAGDLMLVPRTSVNGATRLYAGGAGGVAKLVASATEEAFEVVNSIRTPRVRGPEAGSGHLVVQAGSADGAVVFCHPTTEEAILTVRSGGEILTRDGAVLVPEGATGLKLAAAPSQKIAFWGAAPVARPSGVAPTAEAIHAALVAIGLIEE